MSYLRQVTKNDERRGHYAFAIPAIATLDRLELDPMVTFFVGENGSGKSTLLEAIAMASGFPPHGGSKNMNEWDDFKEERTLADCLRLVRGPRREKDGFFLRAEAFFNVATLLETIGNEAFLHDNYGGNMHEMSHGESFLSLAQHRFRPNSLFFFDEPEAALSPQRQLAFLLLLDELTRQNCQFLIATHSPILMSFPRSKLYVFDEHGLREEEYRKTEHFQLTRDFMLNRDRFLRHLLADGPSPE